jgi:uncharacterized protein YjeT (DUF2065 family)
MLLATLRPIGQKSGKQGCGRQAMSDFLIGIGLVLVIEGLLWALAPRLAFRLLRAAVETPEERLRLGGAAAVAIGVVLVWLARG